MNLLLIKSNAHSMYPMYYLEDKRASRINIITCTSPFMTYYNQNTSCSMGNNMNDYHLVVNSSVSRHTD